jgi:hypothetical protein
MGRVEVDAGGLGELARQRLITPGVVLVVTVRRDGTPRLSPVEPLILDGDLWLSMMWQSRKAADLARDDRILVHSIVTSRDGDLGEVKLRGGAVPVDDAEQRRRYCNAVTVLGWQPEEPCFHLFRLDIDDVTFIRYGPNGDQYVTRWPQGAEYVRSATSPTSVGAPEPHRHLLARDRQPSSES